MTEMIDVSYSEIFKLQTCPRQYYYRFVLGRKPIEESEAIMTGVKGHRLLQTFYEMIREGKSKEEAQEIVKKQAEKIAKEGRLTDFSLVNAWMLVDNYIRANDFTAKALMVEERFLIPARLLTDDPFFADVQIGFTPDIVFERRNGLLDVEDYKFIQRAWTAKKINRYQQSKLYQIFLERMGLNVSTTRIRFFNVKTAVISDKKYILESEEEKTLIHDFLEGVREVVKFKTQPEEVLKAAPRTMNYGACQFCAFEYPCTLEAQGKSAEQTLKTQYMESDYGYQR